MSQKPNNPTSPTSPLIPTPGAVESFPPAEAPSMAEALLTVQQLRASFPYQFSGRHIGIDVFRGWLRLFVEACTTVDQMLGPHKHEFHWVQTKEKYGELRMYFQMDQEVPVILDLRSSAGHRKLVIESDPPDTLSRQLMDRVHEILAPSSSQCIVCGARAPMRNNSGYLLPLCDGHTREALDPEGKRHLMPVWDMACVHVPGGSPW